MIRVYIKDDKIVKAVNQWFFDTEQAPEWATFVDVNFDISDYIAYEWGEVILYKDSTEYKELVSSLQAKKELTEEEQEQLDFLLSL
jgi:hypothetical protein